MAKAPNGVEKFAENFNRLRVHARALRTTDDRWTGDSIMRKFTLAKMGLFYQA